MSYKLVLWRKYGLLVGAILTWNEAHIERNQALASVDGGVWPVGPRQPFTQGTDWVSENKLEKWICAVSPHW